MNRYKQEETQAPFFILLAGTVMVLLLPPVQKVLMSTATRLFHGMLEMAHDLENKKRTGDSKSVQVPYSFDPEFPDEKLRRIGKKLKKGSRDVAVMTAAGALSLVDRTKPFVEEIQSIIKEAKERQSAEKNHEIEPGEGRTDFEKELVKKVPIHPGL